MSSTTTSSILNLGMSYLAPSTPCLQFTEKIGQGAISGESRRQRYVPFSCCAHQLMSKNGPSAVTVHILHRSIPSMMTPFSMCFTSIGHFFCAKTRMPVSSAESHGGDASADVGGTNSHMFAKDGDTLYLGRHPTWVFPSSVQKVRPLQTCWQIRLPSHSISNIVTSLQKMKREQSPLSSSVIASVMPALRCLFLICRSLSCPSKRNIQSWNAWSSVLGSRAIGRTIPQS